MKLEESPAGRGFGRPNRLRYAVGPGLTPPLLIEKVDVEIEERQEGSLGYVFLTRVIQDYGKTSQVFKITPDGNYIKVSESKVRS